jgi:hypothetical protein
MSTDQGEDTMSKAFNFVSAIVLATLVAGIALFSAPAWFLLFPFRYVVGKAEATEGVRLPLPGFRNFVPVGLSICVVLIVGLQYTAIPSFAMLLNGIGIAIGLLPAKYF